MKQNTLNPNSPKARILLLTEQLANLQKTVKALKAHLQKVEGQIKQQPKK